MEKETKSVFVIMPFVEANDRHEKDLDYFFTTDLKGYIEDIDDLKYSYEVSRSEKEFDIPKAITQNLRRADVVLCDMSGCTNPNPNVMLELGIRFSVSHKPVILFREDKARNRPVFDVGWLHTKGYSANQIRPLQEYIRGKLKKYEDNPADYESPVLRALGVHFDIDLEARRSRMLRNLANVKTGLSFIVALMAGRISSYLKEKAGVTCPSDMDSFHQWWESSAARLSKHDWSEFDFQVSGFSPLENLLIHTDVDDYLPEKMRRPIKEKLFRLYIGNFVCVSPLCGDFAPINNRLVGFANAITIIDLIGKYAFADDDEAKREIGKHLEHAVEHIVF